MATLKERIEECADGQPIEAVVIGEMGGDGDFGSEAVPNYANCPKGTVLTWEEAVPWLSYEFSCGYVGMPACQAIYAWTKERVISISQYDGSTQPCTVPRHPLNGMPDMPEPQLGSAGSLPSNLI